MKNFLFLLALPLLLMACNAEVDYFNPELAQSKIERDFQSLKFPSVNSDLAMRTNFYGMGDAKVTRGTTDAPRQAPENVIKAAMKSFKKNYPTQEITPEGNLFITTIKKPDTAVNEYYYLNCLGSSNIGRQVEVTSDSYYDLIRTKDNSHATAKFVTNGEFNYIITPDNGFVYLISKYRLDGYFICIEDLGGKALDYNDVIIYGAPNIKPRIIWRGGNYPVRIVVGNNRNKDKNKKEGGYISKSSYGACDEELPLNNMDSPDAWKNIEFSADNGNLEFDIPVKLNKADDLPSVIATSTAYRFHESENTMSESEFLNIPFYNMPVVDDEEEVYNFGDILYYNSSYELETCSPEAWNSSFGTPLAVCVVPSNLYDLNPNQKYEGYDGKARFMSVKYGDLNNNEGVLVGSQLNTFGTYGKATGVETNADYEVYTMNGVLEMGAHMPSDSFDAYLVSNSNNSETFYGYKSDVNGLYYYENNDELIGSPFDAEHTYAAAGSVLSVMNGKENTKELVKSHTADNLETATTITNGYDEGKMPQAAICYVFDPAKGKVNGVKRGDWFLPSIGELVFIMPRLNYINEILEKVGGAKIMIKKPIEGTKFIDMNSYHATSSVPNPYSSYFLRVSTGQVEYTSRNANFYVRPFVSPF